MILNIFNTNDKSVSTIVVVVIQKDKSRITHKIVTVYPEKKCGKEFE